MGSSISFENSKPIFDFQCRPYKTADVWIVLDDQNTARTHDNSVAVCGGAPNGNRNTKRAPPPGRVSARISPPCASTIARQIASPRPTPGLADSVTPRTNLSNNFS